MKDFKSYCYEFFYTCFFGVLITFGDYGKTRLFIDAQTTEEWRKKDFHTVTESTAADGLNNSILLQILSHKMKNPVSKGKYISEADAPLLTVYRHFDSASVDKGLSGALPRTMWGIDYPLLERIYHALVAGFDVYGTLGYQLAVRLYMDGLRIEGESYFLGVMRTYQTKMF